MFQRFNMYLRAALNNQIKKTSNIKCKRCGMYYSKELDSCPLCTNLNDIDVLEIRKKVKKTVDTRKKLGRIFLLLSLFLFIVIILFYMI